LSYIRKCSITLGSASLGTLDVSNFRCRFSILQMQMLQPNQLYLKVTNLAPSTVQPFLQKEYQTVQISAGYQDGPYGQVFSGDIVQALSGRETQTDTLLTVIAHDAGQARTRAAVNKSLAAGSTPMDHVDEALKAMAPFGVTKGYIGPDLSTPKYPRSVMLYGMAWEILERVARSKQATCSFQQGVMQMIKKQGDHLPGGVIVLNSQSGLIGMPTREIGAVWARCLINPAIKPGVQVQINQALINQQPRPLNPIGGGVVPNVYADTTADGIYTVFQVEYDADTRGLPWYQDLHMISQEAGGVVTVEPSGVSTPGPAGTGTPQSVVFPTS
jgi:hypothetical protein